MSYRPEGWDSHRIAFRTLTKAVRIPVEPNLQEISLVEAGADAILEALRKNGMDIEEGCISCVVALPPPFGLKKGKIVFIPEEE